MEENSCISVIVPVYGVEKYLKQCVDSIVNQTYKNLEIILVDDGSPDNCPQLCDEWVKRIRESECSIKKMEDYRMLETQDCTFLQVIWFCLWIRMTGWSLKWLKSWKRQ